MLSLLQAAPKCSRAEAALAARGPRWWTPDLDVQDKQYFGMAEEIEIPVVIQPLDVGTWPLNVIANAA